jgi:hypothetical protein
MAVLLQTPERRVIDTKICETHPRSRGSTVRSHCDNWSALLRHRHALGSAAVVRLDEHAYRVFEGRVPVPGNRPDIRWRPSLFTLSRRGYRKGFGEKDRRTITCAKDRHHLRCTRDPIDIACRFVRLHTSRFFRL